MTGVGLGLSLCRTIMGLHDGELDVKSGACGGSVFYLLIPPHKVHSEIA